MLINPPTSREEGVQRFPVHMTSNLPGRQATIVGGLIPSNGAIIRNQVYKRSLFRPRFHSRSENMHFQSIPHALSSDIEYTGHPIAQFLRQ